MPIPRNITKDHILQAISEIDINGFDTIYKKKRGQVNVCRLTSIKAKPILRFDFASSHIGRSEARIATSTEW